MCQFSQNTFFSFFSKALLLLSACCVELEIAHSIQQEELGCCLIRTYQPNPEHQFLFFKKMDLNFVPFVSMCAPIVCLIYKTKLFLYQLHSKLVVTFSRWIPSQHSRFCLYTVYIALHFCLVFLHASRSFIFLDALPM